MKQKLLNIVKNLTQEEVEKVLEKVILSVKQKDDTNK